MSCSCASYRDEALISCAWVRSIGQCCLLVCDGVMSSLKVG